MLAIHVREGSFSDKWISYCDKNDVPYKIVNCYSSDIISHLEGCDALMWHWHHKDIKASLFARPLIKSLENIGIKVFPDFNTCWHFDDKLGQKYLFESIAAPLVPSYIFYDLDQALSWIEQTDFPKVFKLRGGAGAENVKLIRNKGEAVSAAKKIFSSGYRVSRFTALRERIWQYKRDASVNTLLNIARGVGRVFFPNKVNAQLPVEKNYFYIQDFVADNDCDIRIITIGARAFGIKRMVRDGDFKASGSGNIFYDPEQIPGECIKIAFETSRKLDFQCAAYDFVFLKGQPLIIEVSYAFAQQGYLNCRGYWDEDLNWYEGAFTPEFFMIEDLCRSVFN